MENKFKKGSWICHGRELHQIQSLDIDNQGNLVGILDIQGFKDTWLPMSKFKPWEPKPNEFCWFLTVNTGYVLGQYVGKLNSKYQYKLNMSDEPIFSCHNCQPFIGKLPF